MFQVAGTLQEDKVAFVKVHREETALGKNIKQFSVTGTQRENWETKRKVSMGGL